MKTTINNTTAPAAAIDPKSVKMPVAIKRQSYAAYKLFVDFLSDVAIRRAYDDEKGKNAALAAASVVKSLHGVDADPSLILVDILTALCKDSVKKATGERIRSLSGISRWNTFLKVYPAYRVDSVVFDAGKAPAEPKPRRVKTEAEKMQSRKEATIKYLQGLSKEDLQAMLAELAAA